MARKKLFTLVLILVFIFSLSTVAVAKDKKKKGKKKKAAKAQTYNDPYKGRVGIGFSLGGSSGSGGTGFAGSVGVTYYLVKYLSMTGSVGYGFAPYLWEEADGDEVTVNVNYVPADLVFHVHPFPGFRISPYFGPGAGITYTWYTFDDEKFEQTWYRGFVDGGITYWVAKNFGLNAGVRYSIPYYEDEWHTDEGQLTFGMSGAILF